MGMAKAAATAAALVFAFAASSAIAADSGAVIGVHEGRQFTYAIKSVASGACKKASGGWRDAFRVSATLGRQPGCWTKEGDRVTFCFVVNGQMDSCMYLHQSSFVEPRRPTFK